MAKDTIPMEQWNANAKRAVEDTMAQTCGALDNYFGFIQKAISSYPSGGTEFGEMLKSYAGKNIAAAQEYVNKLSQAKDFQDVSRIQTEFMQAQFSAFTEQTEESRRHTFKGGNRFGQDAIRKILNKRRVYALACDALFNRSQSSAN